MNQSILSLLDLSPEQEAAVVSDRPAVAVTAGAGSGKTRTLAGRYLWLIEQGHPVRSLVAVTFTEKAAREMRNRIRGFINEWRLVLGGAERLEVGEQVKRWDQAFIELDAARIGTIHSLCAAILRAHPAEAGVDPMFEVLEENTAILLQARSVDQALAWAVEDPICVQLFGPLDEFRLRSTLTELLSKRLDAEPAFRALGEDALRRWSDAAAAWFEGRLGDGNWLGALADLAAISARKPDDKMELARQAVLAHWQAVEESHRGGDWEQVVMGLAAMRKANSSHGAKGNWPDGDLGVARDAMKILRAYHDEQLKPLLGKTPPSWALDERVAALQPGLRRLFYKCLALYDDMKGDRHALDFDDLESMAVALLAGHPDVRARWQADTAAVLVDEFQDTNARQREIIYQITGFASAQKRSEGPDQSAPSANDDSNLQSSICNLFIVGDGKQSIYRFRGADVRVFRQAQIDIETARGQTVDLDTTYRAHPALLETLNQLLAQIMGEEADLQRLYQTPFAPLRPYRIAPKPYVQPPYLEFHVGLGNASEGRASAAAGLARRLYELHEQGCGWKDIALLFRASTAFGVYEDALEAAGIPFVTVAGRGFYNRPEIRDLLNTLAAIADPTDDLAMAGLLRSPMFGLTDAALFLLRWGQTADRGKLGFWQALNDGGAVADLDARDEEQARRAREIVTKLHDMAGRQAVASVLKQLLDETRYRAALRLAAGGERAWRNVDKLLADAHRSRLVGVTDFLEYVSNLRDVAAREGEAAVEADNAVQLMTIHKAKGLEFPVVVLADASHGGGHRPSALLLDDELGPLLRISDEERSEARPLIYQLGVLRQQDMEAAEEKRLLYVAATRAREKLLISGYGRISTSKKKAGMVVLSGWLKELGKVVGLDEIILGDGRGERPFAPTSTRLSWQDGSAGLTIYPPLSPDQISEISISDFRPLTSDLHSLPTDLIAPLPPLTSPDQIDEKVKDKEADPPPRVWRVAATRKEAPNWVVGALVHKALEHWRFPDQDGFAEFLRPFALETGLVTDDEVCSAVKETAKLLKRFQDHPIFIELDQAERQHEVPYSVEIEGTIDAGVVDLLARSSPVAPWKIYDFKTDQLRDEAAMQARIADKYGEQIERYKRAMEVLLRQEPQAEIVFLNVGREIRTEAID